MWNLALFQVDLLKIFGVRVALPPREKSFLKIITYPNGLFAIDLSRGGRATRTPKIFTKST